MFEDLIETGPEVEKVCGDCVHWGQYPSTTGGWCKNLFPRQNKTKNDTCEHFEPWPEVNTEGEYDI